MSYRIKSKGISAAAFALGIAGVTVMLVPPADAHKRQPKTPQQPPFQVMKFTPKAVIRDHRPQPVVRDHRAQPVIRDHRGSGSTGSGGGVAKAVKKAVGSAIKTAKSGKYPGRPPIPR